MDMNMKKFDVVDLSLYCDNDSIAVVTAGNVPIAPHKHEFLELSYVKSGRIRHFFDDREEFFEAGDYFVVDLNTTHGYDAVGNEKVLVINCIFKPEFLDSTMSNRCDSINVLLGSYLIRANSRIGVPMIANTYFHDESGEILNIILKMREEFLAKETGYFEILRGMLIQLIVLTARKTEEDKSFQTGGICARIMQYTKLHYMEDLKFSELCRVFGYSLSYLSRIFSQECGMSFSKYLQMVRIEQSMIMLANTDMKIYEVANNVGYSDINHFCRIFKEITKMTPSEYKKLTEK